MGKPVYELVILKSDGTTVNLGAAIMNTGSSIAVLDEPHAEVHRKMSYAGGKIGTALANGGKFYLIGQNNNAEGKEIHVTASFSATGDVIVRTLGGIEGVTGGTLGLSTNRKGGDTDSGVVVTWGGTPDGSGVASIKDSFLPGGAGPLSLGGQSAFRAERIVPVGGWLGIEVENISGAVLDHFGIEWDFYLADPE